MKIKHRLALSTNNPLLPQVKPWLGFVIVLAIAFAVTEFTARLDVNSLNIALATGIILGIITERKFDLETIYVAGFISSMVIAFILMILLVPLPQSLFETYFVLTATTFLVAIASILTQWLIKNWICRSWNNFWGTISSAIAISFGIIFSV